MDTLSFLAIHPTLFLLILAITSLFVGSFLNVVIYRLPRIMEQSWGDECRLYLGLKPHTDTEKLSLSLPFSHCPHCKKNLMPWHNIPVLSYLFLGGKCAYCHGRISLRYPLVELFTCILSLYIGWKFGVSWQTLAGLVFTWICICLTFIDLDYHLLPDQLTFTLLWTGLFVSLFGLFTNSHDAILGGIAGYLIFAAVQWSFGMVTGKTGMGQGDFKFLAALGAFLGWQQIPFIIMIASIAGLLCAITNMTVKGDFKSVPLPFGPYLAFAGWIALLWGPELTQWYLGYF